MFSLQLASVSRQEKQTHKCTKRMFNRARFSSVLLTYSFFLTLPIAISLRRYDGENLSYPGCGIIPSTSTIRNGESASYPWMAFLYLISLENGNASFCGATLISDIQLVTAAHCLSGKTTDEVAVLIGNPNAQYELNKENFKYLYKIDIFPYYQNTVDGYRYNPDIAVITLEEPLLLSTKINPICLPSVTDTSQTYEGVTATVAGWGKTETGNNSTDQLLKVDVPILQNTECKSTYRWLKRCLNFATGCNIVIQLVSVSTCARVSLGPSQDTAREILADLCSFSTLTKGTITRIRPALYESFLCFRYVQIGVASFGSKENCGSKPGGFSRMTYDVMEWIRTVVVDNKMVFFRGNRF